MAIVVNCYESLFKFLGENLITELRKEFEGKAEIDENQISLV